VRRRSVGRGIGEEDKKMEEEVQGDQPNSTYPLGPSQPHFYIPLPQRSRNLHSGIGLYIERASTTCRSLTGGIVRKDRQELIP